MPPSGSTAQHARFTRIFRERAKAAYRTVLCCGIPASDAEDCVTRVFEIVFDRLASIEPNSERAFVCGVAARVASNARKVQLRRLKLFRHLVPAEWELLPEPPEEQYTNDPERQATRAHGLRLLHQALEGMSEKQRTVFVLCELERFTAREAAKALKIPESAVQSRHRKARASFERFCAARRSEDKRLERKTQPLDSRSWEREHV